MSFFCGACHLLSFALKQLGTASPKYCVRSQLGQRTCWHRQRPRDRIQFGEAAVSVSWFVELVEFVLLWRTGKSWSIGSWCPVVSMSSEMTCVVFVSATPLQPHAAHRACVDVFISPMSKLSLPISFIASAHFHVSVFAVLNLITRISSNIVHADHGLLFECWIGRS